MVRTENNKITNTATEFRLFLQNELLNRCKANPSYSLRAFAKSLAVDNSTLAKILSGKRKIGTRTVEKLGDKLGLTPQEIHRFKKVSVQSNTDSIDDSAYIQIEADKFAIIADWYHYAILELMRLDHFKNDEKWVAKILGISISEVNFAIERLQRVGILKVLPNGKWLDHSKGRSTNISPNTTSSALRNLQKQILEKAITAVDEVPLSLRNNTSMTMAIDVDKLPEAIIEIRQFRRKIAKLLSRGKKRNQVYNLGIALYPLTNIKNEE